MLEAVEVFRVAALPVGREVRRLDAVAPGVEYEGEQAVDIAALIEILSNWDGNFYKMIAQDPCRSVGERRTPAIAPVAGPRSDSRCPSSAEASERPAQRVVSILTWVAPISSTRHGIMLVIGAGLMPKCRVIEPWLHRARSATPRVLMLSKVRSRIN